MIPGVKIPFTSQSQSMELFPLQDQYTEGRIKYFNNAFLYRYV